MTANTQFGWIWGYSIQKGKHGYDSPVAYPSRYDELGIFYGNEKEAEHDALTCIIRDLEKNAGTKNVSLLIWAAKKNVQTSSIRNRNFLNDEDMVRQQIGF